MVLPMTNYIPLSEAAQRLHVSMKAARSMVLSGKIQGGVLPDGEMIVVASSLPAKRMPKKEDLPEYRKHAGWKGVGIGINEAAKLFLVPYTTIYQWVQKGYIAHIGQSGQKVLLDKADVAYCVEIYRRVGSQGRRLFNPDGTPYKPKTGPLAS